MLGLEPRAMGELEMAETIVTQYYKWKLMVFSVSKLTSDHPAPESAHESHCL